MLLIYGEERALEDVARVECHRESVRVRDGKRLVTDGPFAETREQLGGHFVRRVIEREGGTP